MSQDLFISEAIGQEKAGRSTQDSEWELLGESVAVRQLRSQIERIAPYSRLALIRGEAGSGRQAVGRAIHALSPVAKGRFVAIDASVLTDGLEADATNGSLHSAAAEALEEARGGTLYLKSVAELSLERQAALDRFVRGLDERRNSVYLGMRVLAETDRDLRMLAALGQFRKDLYANLAAVEIMVPRLCTRAGDIPVLASSLLERIAEKAGGPAKLLAGSALLSLQRRRWVGNLGELGRVVSEAASRTERGVIEPCHLLWIDSERLAEVADGIPAASERLQDVVRLHVLEVLMRFNGNKLRAAEALGISRSTLYRMLDSHLANVGSKEEVR